MSLSAPVVSPSCNFRFDGRLSSLARLSGGVCSTRASLSFSELFTPLKLNRDHFLFSFSFPLLLGCYSRNLN